jgi:two-component system, NarL family, invasion response regulator UvrY
MIRILVADDHAIVREGLKLIIGETDDMSVVGEAADGWETLDKVAAGGYDIVLLDISMPGLNGLDVLRRLQEGYPDLPVLVLSMYPEQQYAIRAIKNGAAGYITKEEASVSLTGAIRKISNGGRYITPTVAEKLAECMFENSGTDFPHQLLSEREYDVMLAIASGKRLNLIAADLGISAKTVSTYRARLLKKMGMQSDADIVRYVMKSGLLHSA